jgi:hypothetical protein
MLLKIGSTGADVARVHQALLEAGLAVDPSELSASSYGPSTSAAVRNFQQHHVDRYGHALGIDGVVGEESLWALEHPGDVGGFKAPGWTWRLPHLSEPSSLVITVAVNDIGKREDPDGFNDGPDLAKFHTQGLPWCAAAVSTWWKMAPGGCPWGFTAGTATLADWARAHKRVVAQGGLLLLADARQRVLPGDVFVMQHGNGHGHTGLVVGYTEDGRVCTVEGNCGNAVRGCVRKLCDLGLVFRPVGEV